MERNLDGYSIQEHKFAEGLRGFSYCQKVYGLEMSKKIKQRINEIRASETVEIMLQFRIGRCHALKGKRINQYALDLVHPFRLVFVIRENQSPIAQIIDIVDYH